MVKWLKGPALFISVCPVLPANIPRREGDWLAKATSLGGGSPEAIPELGNHKRRDREVKQEMTGVGWEADWKVLGGQVGKPAVDMVAGCRRHRVLTQAGHGATAICQKLTVRYFRGLLDGRGLNVHEIGSMRTSLKVSPDPTH